MFRRVTVAYLSLKDPHRREIYDKLGYQGLAGSEQYAAESVFEVDPAAHFEAFFSGADPEDRDYLLFNGPAHFSDEDEDEDEGDTEV